MTDAISDTEISAERVAVFYSDNNDGDLLGFYAESLDFLEEHGVATDVIDVDTHPEKARENDVVTTPTIVVWNENGKHKHVGTISGLQSLLEEDLYGQALLHKFTFQSGRDLAAEHDLKGTTDPEQIESVLTEYATARGFARVEIVSFDADEPTVTGKFFPAEDRDASELHKILDTFLGGFFTEIFQSGVMGVESKCVKDTGSHCEFVIEPQ